MEYAGLVFVRKMGDKTVLTTILNTKDLPGMLESECQYLITGNNDEMGEVNLTISAWSKEDVSDVSKGNSIEGILSAPIWRNSE